MDLYDKASVDCSKLITKHYSTSFSIGIRLLEKRTRKAIYAIYGFVRLADEIVDSFYDADQMELLKKFKSDTFEAIDKGISTNPVLHSFQWAVNTYSIERELIDAFLYSMEMDLYISNYTSDKYNKYIYGSAEVVGLMCLRVYYSGDNENYNQLKKPAQILGRAFQQINFLRDLQDDYLKRGRIYFPGIDFDNLTQHEKADIESDIEKNLREAYLGIIMLRKGVRLGVYCAYVYYLQLFKKIKRTSADKLLENRIRINNFYKIILMIKSIMIWWFSFYPRKPRIRGNFVPEEVGV